MAKKTVIISEDQLLITSKGEIIKAKELINSKHSLLQWNDSYMPAELESTESIDSDLILIGGAQGRTITCNPNTVFLGNNYPIDGPNIKAIKVSRYLPLFGDLHLSQKELDYLGHSISHLQGKRPNMHLTQFIPATLSKLNRKSLSKIMDILFNNGRVQHLDQNSKDILIILLSRLGKYFDGQTKHVATDITGSLMLRNKKSKLTKNPTKTENIRYIRSCKSGAMRIKFKDADHAIIGSFICQTS